MTAAEMARQVAERKTSEARFGPTQAEGLTTESLAGDPGCAESDDWLFDQPNRSGNRLCIGLAPGVSTDWVDLSDFFWFSCFWPTPSCRGTWTGKVQSVYGGSAQHGYWWGSAPNGNPSFDWAPGPGPAPLYPPYSINNLDPSFVAWGIQDGRSFHEYVVLRQ
jgi:hypothetical protein